MRMVSLLAMAGCRPAATPVSAQKIGNRMAAVLTVMSPLVDQLRSLGLSVSETNEVICAFNDARECALLVTATGTMVLDSVDQFVESARTVLRIMSPTLCAYTDVPAEHLSELYLAVCVIPALVEVSAPDLPANPMVIVPSPKAPA